jgi:hypothetical protein
MIAELKVPFYASRHHKRHFLPSRLLYQFFQFIDFNEKELVGPGGLEPPTPTMSRWCSNQLSYGPIQRTRILMVEANQRKREQRFGHKKTEARLRF